MVLKKESRFSLPLVVAMLIVVLAAVAVPVVWAARGGSESFREPYEVSKSAPRGGLGPSDAQAAANAMRKINGQKPAKWQTQRVVGRPWEEPEPAGIEGEASTTILVLEAEDGQVIEVKLSADGSNVQSISLPEEIERTDGPGITLQEARRRAHATIEELLPGDPAELEEAELHDEIASEWSFVFWRIIGGIPSADGCTVFVNKATGIVTGWTVGWDTVPHEGEPLVSREEALAIARESLVGDDAGLTAELRYVKYLSRDPETHAAASVQCLAWVISTSSGEWFLTIDADTGEVCD